MQLCTFLAYSLCEEDIQRSLDLHTVQCKEVQFACFL